MAPFQGATGGSGAGAGLGLTHCTVYILNVCVCLQTSGTHPESGFQLDLAVCSGALQHEALVQGHVGGVEEATQGQVEHAERSLLLWLFDLDHKDTNETIQAVIGDGFLGL